MIQTPLVEIKFNCSKSESDVKAFLYSDCCLINPSFKLNSSFPNGLVGLVSYDFRIKNSDLELNSETKLIYFPSPDKTQFIIDRKSPMQNRDFSQDLMFIYSRGTFLSEFTIFNNKLFYLNRQEIQTPIRIENFDGFISKNSSLSLIEILKSQIETKHLE